MRHMKVPIVNSQTSLKLQDSLHTRLFWNQGWEKGNFG